MKTKWQRFIAWLKRTFLKHSETTNQQDDQKPDPVEPDPVVSTGDLIDPPSPSAEYVVAHAESEECSIEPASGREIRCCVWYPSRGRWFMISSPFVGHVHGKQVDNNFAYKGGVFTIRGWRSKSWGNVNDANPPMDETGTSSSRAVSYWECRAAK